MGERAKTVELNDRLRMTFEGGRVQVLPGIFDLDARLCGRALCVMSRQTATSPDHDWGTFVFAGYVFEWWIEDRSGDGPSLSTVPADANTTPRILTLYAVDDLLLRAASVRSPAAQPSRSRRS